MELNDANFVLYAARCYDVRSAASSEDFYEDLKRFQHLKRLFRRYHENQELRTRLILNHLIIIYNCFGVSATNMLFLRLREYHVYLKPFVDFLNFTPQYLEFDGEKILASEIPADINIIKELRLI